MPLIPGDTPLLSYNLRMEAAIAHLAMFLGRLSHCDPLLLQRAKLQPNLPPSDRKPGPPLLSLLRNSKPREKAKSRRGTKILSFALLLLAFHFLLHLQSFWEYPQNMLQMKIAQIKTPVSGTGIQDKILQSKLLSRRGICFV